MKDDINNKIIKTPYTSSNIKLKLNYNGEHQPSQGVFSSVCVQKLLLLEREVLSKSHGKQFFGSMPNDHGNNFFGSMKIHGTHLDFLKSYIFFLALGQSHKPVTCIDVK